MAKFKIKAEFTPHGSFSWEHSNSDAQWAESGDAVRLLWTNDAKWGLQEAHYTDAQGNVTDIDITSDIVEFIMPAKDITIGGTFKRFVTRHWTEGKKGDITTGNILKVGTHGEPVPTQITEEQLANIVEIAANAQSVTRDELYGLITDGDGDLVPGRWYRITDYQCTTKQTGTQAATHQFDILVLALDNAHLSENAYAARHAGDTYFSGSNLEAWRLKYTIFNDKSRFVWADDSNGKGVIFFMEDEYGNEAPFDFKNMMFERTAEWFGENSDWSNDVLGLVPDSSMFFYLFSWHDDKGNIHDASVVCQTIPSDEGVFFGVVGNVVKETTAASMEIESSRAAFALPDNIFVSSAEYDNGYFYGRVGNTLGNDCFGNTFGNGCFNNTMGNDCFNNTMGNDCEDNTMGDSCSGNTLGNSCTNNTLGNYCSGNTFGNGCNGNTLGNYCSGNTFGNGCNGNTFGNNCSGNTFGNYCLINTFGNYCGHITLGNSCNGNTFGNYCEDNTMGGYCNGNTIGNSCKNIDLSVINSQLNNPLANVEFMNGVDGLNIDFADEGLAAGVIYSQFVGYDSQNDLKIWNPAD